MSKIIISADSTGDIPPELIEKYNIQILPLIINLGEKSYADGVDIVPKDIMEFVDKTGELPTTSTVSLGTLNDFFTDLSEQADDVIYFSIGSGFSSSYQNAYLASQDFSNVHVVDTQNLSIGEALIVWKAAELAEQGKSALEIVDFCNLYKLKVRSSFVIDKLEYLRKGGRCSTVTALGANLLQIKPTIEVIDGKMDVGKKYRGKFSSILSKYICDMLKDVDPIDGRILIAHTVCPQEYVDIFIKTVEDTGKFSEIICTDAGCTIFSHCGPNTLGMMFATEN